MNATEEILRDSARQAQARFFLKAGRSRGSRCGDEYTLPLFGLQLILEAEGLLSAEVHYLERCEQAIAEAARAWRA